MIELELIENKENREKVIERVEVLDQVKEILTLGNTEFVTVELAAQYYEVGKEVVKKVIQRHREELETDGLNVYKQKDIKKIIETVENTKKGQNVPFKISPRGMILIPKRALLRIGMLLRDSQVAKEVRSRLLDIIHDAEVHTDIVDKIVEEIRTEQQICEEMTQAIVNGDSNKLALLQTELIGLKNKRIAVIGENRYEWEMAYLAVVCGTGIVVPLDRSLPENELEKLIKRSHVEAIFYSKKYEEALKKIISNKNTNLKFLISMDTSENKDGIYSEFKLIEKGRKLIENGDKRFINSVIEPEKMSIMLFTSGTTSESKVVSLSHKNIAVNLMDIASILDVSSDDRILSFLPVHHVFGCTVGFLFSLYLGAQTSFCDGIKYIVENLKEYEITFSSFVPAIYENIYRNIIRKLEKEGKLQETQKLMEKYKNHSMEEKKEVFKEIHDFFGGHIRLLLSGAAALDKNVEQAFRDWGINLCQGYGLTETSPVIAVETNSNFRVGSVGKAVPHVEARLEDVNEEGIGELVVKGPNIMLGYFENEEATKEAIIDGWFHTGDLATIDEDGYIFICGRKKSVIVLKNGKNIFPEEMENLVNKITGVKESFIFGK